MTKPVEEIQCMAAAPLLTLVPGFGPSFGILYTVSAVSNFCVRIKNHKSPLYCGFSDDTMKAIDAIGDKLIDDDPSYR